MRTSQHTDPRAHSESTSRFSPDIALLAWLYLAELCLVLIAIALHKKGDRSIATFAVAPAGRGLLIGVALFGLCAFAIASHYRRRRGARPFAFAVVVLTNVLTVTAMLIVGEVAVRILSVRTPAGAAFASTMLLPKDWSAIAARNRATLQTAAAEGSYLVFDPHLGWTIGKSRRSEDPYKKYRSPTTQPSLGKPDDIYLSSAEGLRSPVPGMSFADSLRRNRIALIGDSFTFGLEVHYDETWGHQLELALGAGTQVLNFGVDGYGVDQAILRYRREVLRWHPRIVVFSVINDDMRRTLCIYGFLCFPTFGEIPFPKPRFVAEGDSIRLLAEQLPDPSSIFAAKSIADLPFVEYDGEYEPSQWEWHFYDHSYLARYVFSRFQRWPELRPTIGRSAMLAINGALVQQFIRLARANGSTPIVVFLPSSRDFSVGGENELGAARTVLKAKGIPFLDLTDCVRKIPAAERFIILHYSATTNRAVAECLAPIIRTAVGP